MPQLMDRNPEFAQMVNNPQLLQEAMAASANPVCWPCPTCNVQICGH